MGDFLLDNVQCQSELVPFAHHLLHGFRRTKRATRVVSGLRACIIHWEKQHKDRSKDFIAIPMEVIERGASSVKTYLKDAANSNLEDLVYRCKICVVGPSEWGKCSLVKSIETSKPFLMGIRDRTIGNELVASTLADSEMASTIGGDRSAKVSHAKQHEVTFWDFAGQDVYQTAHSLFFSRRTVYLLVVDVHAYSRELKKVEPLRSAARETAMGRFLSRHVFRWVRTIFARQPDAEFVVIGTKADMLKNEEADSTRVWCDLQSRVFQWKLNYLRELEAEYGVATEASRKITGQTDSTDLTSQDSRVMARVRELTKN